ncbi:hypothetical protein BRCON_1813 [Candidatus Sumerlaea chitinivorans]|uniref:Uncharacterized protein n=1 Tax=Sumerlaea chitinivorans TaxID=2250252 RepID=A0A2Z4Y5Z0_SUMC1|nr:hypothetical protein BRCON_1813 [Candidatus Sumerlaea chitinivorans]
MVSSYTTLGGTEQKEELTGRFFVYRFTRHSWVKWEAE